MYTPNPSDDEYNFIFKVLLLGNSNVGKSSLFLRFVDDTWNDTFVPTIGVDFKIKSMEIDDKKIKMQIWDTAGQERFKNNWLIEIEKNASKNISRVLIGNKCDLEDKRVISYAQGKEFADTYGLKFIETSAKKNKNVKEAFETLGREIMKSNVDKKITKDRLNKKITVSKAQDLNMQEKGGCC